MGLGLRLTRQYTVLTRFSVRNSKSMLSALSRATQCVDKFRGSEVKIAYIIARKEIM